MAKGGRGGKRGSGGGATQGNDREQFIDEMVKALNNNDPDEIPMSNSDLQAAVEAYAMTHKGVNEDALLEEIQRKANPKTLTNKSQVDELTASYTPEKFLGKTELLGDTLNSLRAAAENNAPDTLNVGGYTFKNMGKPYVDFEQTGRTTGKNIVKLDYQSTEKIGNEYPVLQIGIRTWRTKGGKIKSEIIRDGYTNKTRFW